MTIEIHKPELEQRVREEIESGHFYDVDELLSNALDALREKEANMTTRIAPTESGKPLRLVDALMSPPFLHSELYIPARQKDYPQAVDL